MNNNNFMGFGPEMDFGAYRRSAERDFEPGTGAYYSTSTAMFDQQYKAELDF